MQTTPFCYQLDKPDYRPSSYDNHIKRTLSSMKCQYVDQEAYDQMLAKGDVLLYEVYEILRPEISGELMSGVSVVHPGKVGTEYFMTKGHYHSVLDTAEIYYTHQGFGYMVMETPEGDWAVEELYPGRVLYILPRWGHRSVNDSSTEDLVMYFIYPGHAGHDYGTIEEKGFRKLVLERSGRPQIIDNPRWSHTNG